jgi:serine/threonine-protein kinase
VLHVLTQICGALAEAHDLGLVHRDVKPANILLSPRKNEHEFAKIVDFGLVKSVDPTLTLAPAGVTATNSITGTPLYMAPESIKAPDSVDARADLYALGAVAWFLLVGRPPFQGTTIVEVCGQHLHAAPLRPSAALRRAVPADLEDVILACLEKDPGARPRDARELRTRLEACESYGRWKTEHATAWWRMHIPGEPSAPVDSTVRQTIALDVGDRATEDVRLGA